jgi:alkylhydroperoxidase family enzyme
MAFIDYIEYDDASPELKKLYQRSGAPKRTPANIIRVSGVNPKSYAAHLAFNMGVMGNQDSALAPQQRELIAVVVSAINQCHY